MPATYACLQLLINPESVFCDERKNLKNKIIEGSSKETVEFIHIIRHGEGQHK
jgi:hypothetical protein